MLDRRTFLSATLLLLLALLATLAGGCASTTPMSPGLYVPGLKMPA